MLKPEIKTDRQKVNTWLDSINETDQATRDEVLGQCAKDKDARAYYVNQYVEMQTMPAMPAMPALQGSPESTGSQLRRNDLH